jgi:prepilin-type N-terminal cleavage/methylation domain-containing protein
MRPGRRRTSRERTRSLARPTDGGFTLLEVMVAIILVAGLLVATTQIVISETRLAGDNQYAIAAANLANQTIGTDQTEPFSTLIADAPPSQPPYVQTQKVGAITYTISTQTYWQPESATAGGCDNPGSGGSGPGLADILLVEVTVGWNMAGQDAARADALITPPVTQGSNSEGNIALQVVGPAPANTPQPQVPIQVDGPGGVSTYYTDSNGCLFLGYQPLGNYWFTATQPAGSTGVGWVTQDEQSTDQFGSSTSPVVLTTQQPITQTLDYSQGGALVVTFSGAGPAPVGLPVTVSNSSLTAVPGNPNSGTGTYTFPGGTSSVASETLTPLWPYSSGYSVFAGHCPEANPAAVDQYGTPLYSGITAPTALVTANQTATVDVPLYPLTVNVTSSSGQPVSGYTVSLNEQPGGAKSACSPTQSYRLAGTTSATGSVTAGIPLGHFTVSVQVGSSTYTSASFYNTGAGDTATVTIP